MQLLARHGAEQVAERGIGAQQQAVVQPHLGQGDGSGGDQARHGPCTDVELFLVKLQLGRLARALAHQAQQQRHGRQQQYGAEAAEHQVRVPGRQVIEFRRFHPQCVGAVEHGQLVHQMLDAVVRRDPVAQLRLVAERGACDGRDGGADDGAGHGIAERQPVAGRLHDRHHAVPAQREAGLLQFPQAALQGIVALQGEHEGARAAVRPPHGPHHDKAAGPGRAGPALVDGDGGGARGIGLQGGHVDLVALLHRGHVIGHVQHPSGAVGHAQQLDVVVAGRFPRQQGLQGGHLAGIGAGQVGREMVAHFLGHHVLDGEQLPHLQSQRAARAERHVLQLLGGLLFQLDLVLVEADCAAADVQAGQKSEQPGHGGVVLEQGLVGRSVGLLNGHGVSRCRMRLAWCQGSTVRD